LFEAPHNQTIKWDHLLRQTSIGKEDLGQAGLADRPKAKTLECQPEIVEPGTHYKYNEGA